jgi:hypothetical protein
VTFQAEARERANKARAEQPRGPTNQFVRKEPSRANLPATGSTTPPAPEAPRARDLLGAVAGVSGAT